MTPPADRPIVIAEYDPAWPEMFEVEAAIIFAVTGNIVRRLEHIGSTAVPGLAAKPVIDILAGVDVLDLARAAVPAMQRVEYEYVPEFEEETPQRLYFRKDVDGARAFHVHMVELTSDWWADHLLFRDWLRAHPDDARAYAALKRDLAAKHGADRVAYTDAKTGFVRECLARARAAGLAE